MVSQNKIATIIALLVSTILSNSWVEPNYKQSRSDEEIYTHLQELNSSKSRNETQLPSRVDNTHSKYMRPVFSQGSSGSCGSASRISYMFAYELNNYRDLDGSLPENIYPSFFTWLLTGQNSGKWQMAAFNGIPNSVVYGGDQASHIFHEDKIWNLGWPTDANGANYGWMQGYDRWKHAATNRLERTENIKLDSREKIEYIKQWFNNHMGDTTFSSGGVLGGGVASSGWSVSTIPAGQHEAGKKIISQFGPQIDHGIVWSGYDDSVSFDLNQNGLIEEDEKGAIIMLNSWGANWGNSGSVYIPYKLLIENGRWAEYYYIRKDYRPQDVLRVKMNYSQRNNLKLSIGISSDPLATKPTTETVAEHFYFAGNSPIPMLGTWQDGTVHSEDMEFALDLSDLKFGLDTRDNFRYFLILETNSNASGTGTVEELQVVHYKNYSADGTVYDSAFTNADIQRSEITGAGTKIYIPITVKGSASEIPNFLYIPQKRFTSATTNTEQTTATGAGAIDGDRSTMWHSRWSTGRDPFPHDIKVELDSSFSVSGLEYLPRQDGSSNGRIGNYEIYISSNPSELGTLVTSGVWTNNSTVKRVFWDKSLGSVVTLRSLTAANGDNNTCVSELNLFASPADEVSNSGASINKTPKRALFSSISGRTLSLNLKEGENYRISLVLPNGRSVYTKKLAGTGVTSLNMGDRFASGIYILNIAGAVSNQIVKISVK